MAGTAKEQELEGDKGHHDQDSINDVPYCRICRGERSQDEPLFYPCKCSGSIKYVHQACLMEWLSHSQKKHCEVCKTPFRFTKLYDPHMPTSVPLDIFVKQAFLHIFRGFVTLSRWILVIFVWLGMVPWCMRSIWRGLFWLGDGAWITRQEFERYMRRLARFAATTGMSSLNGTSSPSNATTPARASMAGILSKWGPISQTLNSTSREPAILWIAKRIASGVFFPFSYTTMISSHNTLNNSTSAIRSSRSPSLLSEVKFLQKLTRWQPLNNILTDILEGQMITLGIVITFILVFLIREWVVQQQPIVNMGGGADAARALEGPARGGRNRAPVPEQPQNDRPNGEDARAVEELQATSENNTEVTDQELNQPEKGNTVGEGNETILIDTRTVDYASNDQRQLRRMPATDFSLAHVRASKEEQSEQDLRGQNEQVQNPENASVSSGSLVRPPMPAKGTAVQATDIQRTLEEQSGASGEQWPGVEVFMDLWNRGEGDPDRILGIIEEDGRLEELGWIASTMKRLQRTNTLKDSVEISQDSSNNQEQGSPPSQHEGISEKSSDSWQLIEEQAGGHQFSSDDLPFNTHQQDNTNEQANSSDSSDSSSNISSLHAQYVRLPSDDNGSPDASAEVQTEDVNSSANGTRTGEAALENEPRTISAAVKDWLWGELPQADVQAAVEPDGDEERVVENIADEAPFVPVADGQPIVNNVGGDDVNPENPPADPEVIRAAAEAGIDPNEVEAVEEGEDLEGVMELVGVQGPLAGLFQNGMFSTVLISVTVFFGIWVPYVVGKLILVLMANPIVLLIKIPLRWASTTADMVLDLCIFFVGCTFYWLDCLVRFTAAPIGWILPTVRIAQRGQAIPLTAYRFTWSAAERLAKNFIATSGHFSEWDVPIFSIVAHESLKKIENAVIGTVSTLFSSVKNFSESPSPLLHVKNQLWYGVKLCAPHVVHLPERVAGVLTNLAESLPSLLRYNIWKINLDIPVRKEPFDYELSNWNIKDRLFTIVIGYIFFSAAGAAYLKFRRFIKDFQQDGTQPDGVVVDTLNQAAGVLKVILIIAIEMIAFPLYCGMLLDIALLPLFEDTTVVSRALFTVNSPITSCFVHWFVGTCYMFHFALFVSMCRKIMRSGVLYFIRDPDDPSFHPVRDVLERNVSTQLRKILFSALVYGGLVIVCLGTVVWGVSSVVQGIFPIHWSSNEPVLEFPVDLLVYNFLVPVAIKFFKPSTGLQSMYKWWFQKCARALRLTHFLFNERREDEEGYYIRTTITKAKHTWNGNDREKAHQEHFIRDSRLVRAPASDQVRIPKGGKTFVEIDEDGNRVDGFPDNHQGLHGRDNTMFSSIYIPPHFRLRVAIFIILLWLFAATTGLSLTIVPLAFGRYVFSLLIPSHPRMNDIYAFAIGIYLLGGPLYLVALYRSQLSALPHRLAEIRNTMRADTVTSSLYSALYGILRFLRLLYFYGAFTLLLPSLFALVYEAYLLIPLCTYFNRNPIQPSPYTIHFISGWTLSVLCVRIGIRILLHFNDTRPSRALRALVSPQNNGATWFNPDIRLATRAFILPLSILLLLALLLPLGVGRVLNAAWFHGADENARVVVYRYSYPAVMFVVLSYAFARVLRRAIGKWRIKVRDEVYLIGERLHNFGESRPRVNRIITRH